MSRKPKEKPKLTIELVPRSLWQVNLRKSMPRSAWDKLRKKTYAEYGYRCGICGADARLNCHEIWGYDDKKRIQKLRGFIALCDLCHHVKHLGRASQLARQGSLDMEKVIEHFMEVNGCDRKTFDQQKKEAKAQWEKRSQSPWECDSGKFAPSGFNK